MKIFQFGFALLLASGVASAQQYVLSTVAGIPQVQGYFGDGASAGSAQLDRPTQITVDSKGNYYWVDYYTFVVRMVTASSGKVITIAGNGTYGWVDGSEQGPVNSGTTILNAGISEIGYAKGLAVDGSGNVYIGDTSNCRIRKVDTSQNTTTIAGNGNCTFTGDGGAATAASLWFPSGLAIDKSGNIYEAEYGSSTVRKIDSSGKITTVAGSMGTWGNSGDGGAATKASLASPVSLAIDSAGDIFIGDTGNQNIREITTDGNIHTVASNVTPTSLTLDASGNLYFVDGVTPLVWEVLPNGTVLAVAGNGTSGYNGDLSQATTLQLNSPGGVAAGPNGTIYVADTYNQVIRVLTPVPYSVGAITNSASNVQGAIAPGEIVTVYGNGIGPATLTKGTVTNGVLPSQISGAPQIYFGGTPAPLLYTSSGVASAIVPYNVAGSSTANVVLALNGQVSVTTVVPVTNAAPGIFTANSSGTGQAAAINVATGTVNSASNPVKVGGYISLYVSGAGVLSPAGVEGRIATSISNQVLPVLVSIGGVPAPVSYAGSTPLVVTGLTQVNVQIPAGVPVGSAVPVTLSAGGVPAPPGVTIAVSN
jgi:uncharacterized protein (TIGR03437 family)